jgi:hypothetical protein
MSRMFVDLLTSELERLVGSWPSLDYDLGVIFLLAAFAVSPVVQEPANKYQECDYVPGQKTVLLSS